MEAISELSGNALFIISKAQLVDAILFAIDEHEKRNTKETKTDERLFPNAVCKLLGITMVTLWRWKKSGYLRPAGNIGRKPFYLMSQIETLTKMQTA